MARVAVAGATGLVGRAATDRLREAGHDVVPISRSDGVDVLSTDGLDEALNGVQVVVDVLNTSELDPEKAVAYFETATGNLLEAERLAGVDHHVLLSIVNVDTVEGNGHYAGKRAQERVVEAGPVPWTILRATQFHDFAAMVAGWTTVEGVATVAPLLVQPVAVVDVAAALTTLAGAGARGRAADLAGPDTHDFVDMARRTLTARDDPTRIRASWQDGPFDVGMAGEVLLPGRDADLGTTTFEDWLADQHPATGDAR